MAEEYEVHVEPIHRRDDSPIKMLGGFTFLDLTLLFASMLFAMFAIPWWPGKLIWLTAHITWIKVIRDSLPEGFVQNGWAYFTKKDLYLDPSLADTEWVHPIKPKKPSSS